MHIHVIKNIGCQYN